MNINDLTLGQVKELMTMVGGSPCAKETPFRVGDDYLIRTVTHIDVGHVVDIAGDFLVMEQASWIADTGRYHDCLKKGVFTEVEPYPTSVYINMSSIIDAAPWEHDLPKEQK